MDEPGFKLCMYKVAKPEEVNAGRHRTKAAGLLFRLLLRRLLAPACKRFRGVFMKLNVGNIVKTFGLKIPRCHWQWHILFVAREGCHIARKLSSRVHISVS